MKLSTLLITPWRLSSRSRGWFVAVVFSLCLASAILVGRVLDDRKAWVLATMLYCAGIGLFWIVQVPHLLLVSIGARRLRLPGVRQTITGSANTYAVLCIAAPVLVLTPLGANPLAVALAAALTITACMSFVLLPRYTVLAIGLLLFVVGAALNAIAHSLPEHPGHATLTIMGLGALVILTWVDVWRWRALSQDRPQDRSGWRTAMILQLDRNGAFSLGSGLAPREGFAIRQRPAWFQAEADLRDADRRHPARAIRIVLGPAVMPLTWRSRVRQWLYVGGFLAFEALVFFWLDRSSGIHSLLHSSWFWLAIGGVMAVALSNARLLAVQQRWHGADANLALLGLLPGLGPTPAQKRHLLSAVLPQPLAWLLALLLACWATVAITGAPAATGFYGLLIATAAAGLLVTGVLGVLGGRPIRDYWILALFAALMALAALTPGADRLARLFHFNSAVATAYLRELLFACWLAWLLMVGMLTLRGWRGLQHRPHPFLANDS